MLRHDPFRGLNQLPDDSRLGWRLILGGLALGLAPFAWMRLDPKSFQRAGDLLFRVECYVKPSFATRYSPSPDSLFVYFIVVAAICLMRGGFIFARKGVWWVAEHRGDDKSVTQIDLK